MKKVFGSCLVSVLVIVAMIFVMKSEVSAGDFSVTSSGHSFNSDWEEERSFSGSRLVYGYNTFLINEDYSHSNKKYSVAYVVNDNGTHRGMCAFYTTWSKIEVQHAGTKITYGAIY